MIYAEKVHDVAKQAVDTHGKVVVVDRLWPRGVAKADLAHDEWFKDVAPSPELRKSWNHDPERFEEFTASYRAELDANESEQLEQLLQWAAEGDVTVLFAAADREVNHAVVLRDWLAEQG